jgi:short-chain fatty acids transporter
LLTFFVFGLGIFFFKPSGEGLGSHSLNILSYWYNGLWDGSFLVFAYQMILILVLGHVLALSKPAARVIRMATRYCTSNARSAAIVCLLCVFLGLINWGLALIFGAIFARKVAEHAQEKGIDLNYPLIAACGYFGLMVWHGGFSGSSLIKVAETGHLQQLTAGNQALAGLTLPDAVGFSETVFSPMNLTVCAALLIILPLAAHLAGQRVSTSKVALPSAPVRSESENQKVTGAARVDHHPLPAYLLGALALGAVLYTVIDSLQSENAGFINPNFLNLILLGLGLLAHGSLARFGGAVKEAITGAAGILIQFPLYFGILGIMQNAGIVSGLSEFFVQISNETTYPIFGFLSAGFVNILVPSGGGQWMVQGPIVIEASTQLGLPLSKSIMALAYGDQVTNMLQPFWALPLLAVTGLKARDILPYTLYFMVIGMVIYISALLIF